MSKDTFVIIHLSEEQIDELVSKVLVELVKRTDKKMNQYFKDVAEKALSRDAEMERHAQTVECLLDNMNKILEKKL